MAEVFLDKSLYDKDQLEQLQLGHDHGVDISLYENPEYMALQMEWIRRGLEDGIDVSLYASTAYDWFQMEEIYKGIVGLVDVSKYLSSDIPYDRMREIRKGLEQGVDLSPFEKYGSKELKQLRHALKDNIHIVKYMVEGYDAEQLEVIRKAIASGINIDPYLEKEYRGIALEEIVLGLKRNLKVEVYAKTSYSWQQMREIREGLVERLDVSMYSSNLYNASQMHEIRLGLEAGLDVTFYRSLMYTAKEMRKIRQRLIEELTGGSSIAMVPGADGYHEYLFNMEKTGEICILSDGSVDFKKSFQYATCKTNDVIAIYHGASEGKNGISNEGKVIKATKGKEKKILSGKGVYYDEKYRAYIAAVSGWIYLNEEEDLLEIRPAVYMENITASMGKVVMSGNVEILGNITSGSRLEIDGDLVVNGHVEDANINCSGKLIIRGGINGNGNAKISVGESLYCMYVENCEISAGGEVRADYIFSSIIEANGEVIIAGSHGSITGSTISSGKGITCVRAGNDAGNRTELSIVFSEEIDNKERLLKDKKKKVLKELEILTIARARFRSKYPAEIRNINSEFIKIENAIYTKNLELNDIDDRLRLVSKQKKSERSVDITVTDKIYEGVIFRIGNAKYESSREKGLVKIENYNGKICVTKG